MWALFTISEGGGVESGQKVEGFTTSTQDVAEWVKWMTGVYCYPYSLLKLFSRPSCESFFQRRAKEFLDKEHGKKWKNNSWGWSWKLNQQSDDLLSFQLELHNDARAQRYSSTLKDSLILISVNLDSATWFWMIRQNGEMFSSAAVSRMERSG